MNKPIATGERHGRLLDTVNLVDTDSGARDSYRFDAGWHVEEHVLVPSAPAVPRAVLLPR